MRRSRCLAIAALALGVVLLFGARGATPIRAADGATPSAGGLPTPDRPRSTTSAVTLSVQPDPAMPGEPATLTATVTCTPNEPVTVVSNGAGPGTPTGTVTFTGNGAVLAVVALNEGSASFTLTVPTSSSIIVVALYSGDERCAPAVSAPLSLPSPFAAVNTQVVVTLGIVISGCGSTTPPAATTVNLFQAIPITAIPCTGSAFTGWANGPCKGTQINPCDIAPDGLTTITPIFTP